MSESIVFTPLEFRHLTVKNRVMRSSLADRLIESTASASNDRDGEYGGSLEDRARFAVYIVRATRDEVGDDYQMRCKSSAVDYNTEMCPWASKGNTIDESVQVSKWLEEAG